MKKIQSYLYLFTPFFFGLILGFVVFGPAGLTGELKPVDGSQFFGVLL
jgi:hypothetical protein